ncbi:MAG: amino acid permease [Flavobacteriaceae bacterium]|nr:amino acid permease [Flavobacteriaceae bacterium]
MNNSYNSKKITLLNAISIGVGGMVGGGIFAVLGLAVSIAKGGTPIAFLLAGLIALLTAYSYSKLSLRYPENGGTVDYIDAQYGEGIFSGGINNLLWFSYIVMLALYASAFGSYGNALYHLTSNVSLNTHIYESGILIIALLLNFLSVKLVGNIESFSVIIKLTILFLFVVLGLYGLSEHSENIQQLELKNWATTMNLISGGMVIFVAYEGFELIANSVSDLKNREKNTAKSYFISVVFVIILYLLIAVITIGSLPFSKIASAQDYVLAEAAEPFLGKIGFTIITITALISTFSAINATVLGSGRVNYDIAQNDELPKYFTHQFHGKPIGFIVTAFLSLLLVNFFNLESISTAGSSGFLLIFTIVNFVAFKKHKLLQSNKLLHLLATALSFFAFIVLLIQQFETNILGFSVAIGIIFLSFLVEFIYRRSK